MDISVFTDLTKNPQTKDLKFPLAATLKFWKEIRNFVFEQYPTAKEEWFVSVKKYGWSFRIKDKKRAIIYLSPGNGYFNVVMIFGQKATDKIIASNISEELKTELLNSKVYMEGRVLRFEVHNELLMEDIKKLVLIKITN